MISVDVIREYFEEAFKKLAEKRQNEVYVSELAKCLRYAYYSRVYPLEPTVQAILGIDIHSNILPIVTSIISSKSNCQCDFEKSVMMKLDNGKFVRGKVDIYCSCGEPYNEPFIIELKTTSNPTSNNRLLPWYRRQLMYYLALLDVRIGYLVLTSFSLNTYYIAGIIMTKQEMEQIRGEIVRRAEQLISSVMPEAERGEWCKLCPYKRKCISSRLI